MESFLYVTLRLSPTCTEPSLVNCALPLGRSQMKARLGLLLGSKGDGLAGKILHQTWPQLMNFSNGIPGFCVRTAVPSLK
jgi:hypothetical protein